MTFPHFFFSISINIFLNFSASCAHCSGRAPVPFPTPGTAWGRPSPRHRGPDPGCGAARAGDVRGWNRSGEIASLSLGGRAGRGPSRPRAPRPLELPLHRGRSSRTCGPGLGPGQDLGLGPGQTQGRGPGQTPGRPGLRRALRGRAGHGERPRALPSVPPSGGSGAPTGRTPPGRPRPRGPCERAPPPGRRRKAPLCRPSSRSSRRWQLPRRGVRAPPARAEKGG